VRALPGEAVIANRDFVSPPLPLADQPGSALQPQAESYSGLSAFLQILSDLGKLPLGLWAQTAQRNFRHSVCDFSDQLLAAEMWGSIHLVEMAPRLAKFADVQRGEARERLPSGVPLSGGTTIFCCPARSSRPRRSLSASPPSQPSSAGQRRRGTTGMGAPALRGGPDDARHIAYCGASL
jgi:hypothetical protein